MSSSLDLVSLILFRLKKAAPANAATATGIMKRKTVGSLGLSDAVSPSSTIMALSVARSVNVVTSVVDLSTGSCASFNLLSNNPDSFSNMSKIMSVISFGDGANSPENDAVIKTKNSYWLLTSLCVSFASFNLRISSGIVARDNSKSR